MDRKRVSSLLAVAVAILCGVSFVTLAQGPKPKNPSASGAGFSGNIALTFSAVGHTSATDTFVTGIAQQHDRVTGIKTTLDITCIRVNGNQARIGGTVLRTTGTDMIGAVLVFDVVDHGEGVNAPPDEFNLFHADDGGCEGNPEPTMPSDNKGNIQVRGSGLIGQ